MIVYCIVEHEKGMIVPKVIEEIKDKERAIARRKELQQQKYEINALRKLEGKRPVEDWGVYIGDTFECMIGERIF